MRAARRLILSLTLAAFASSASGCFGSFQLVRKVYDFNKGVGNKWVNELVFLVFVILPVYGFASLGDAIIFNTIEFWTGHNPLAMKEGETEQRVVEKDGEKATITFRDQGRTIDLLIERPNEAPRALRLQAGEDGAVLSDAHGQVLARSMATEEGGVVVVDGRGEPMLHRGADRVQLAVQALTEGPAAFLALERRPVCEAVAAR